MFELGIELNLKLEGFSYYFFLGLSKQNPKAVHKGEKTPSSRKRINSQME